MRINNYLKLPLTVLTFAVLIATFSPKTSFLFAQSQNNKEYFYLYFGEQIPIQPRPNQTAVQEKPGASRSGNESFAANLLCCTELCNELRLKLETGDIESAKGKLELDLSFGPRRDNYDTKQR